MKVHAVVAMVVFTGLAGCWETGVKGSGKARSEQRRVAAFNEIRVSGAVNVEFAIAPEVRLEVSGDDNLVPLIDTEVSDNRLQIRNHESIRPVVPLVIRVAAPRLSTVVASGASTVTLHGVRDDQLTITADGASTLHGDGAVHQLTIDASAASTLDLDQLAAERASIKSSGASTVGVDVTQALDVHVSGAATVNYRGDPPELKRDVSTAGTLNKR